MQIVDEGATQAYVRLRESNVCLNLAHSRFNQNDLLWIKCHDIGFLSRNILLLFFSAIDAFFAADGKHFA